MSGGSIALRKIQSRQSEQRSAVPDFNSEQPYHHTGGNKMFLDLVKSGSYELAAKSLNKVNNVYIKDTENGNNVLHYIASQSGGYIKNSSQNLLNVMKSNIQTLSNAKNYQGDTPLHIAAQNGNDQLIHFFKQHGADFNIQNGNGKRVRLSDDINNIRQQGGVLPNAPSVESVTINEKELDEIKDSLNRIKNDIDNRIESVGRSFSDTIESSKVFENMNKDWNEWKPQQKLKEFENKLKEVTARVETKVKKGVDKNELEKEVNNLRQYMGQLKQDAMTRGSTLQDQFKYENMINSLEQKLSGAKEWVTPQVTETYQNIQNKLQKLQKDASGYLTEDKKQNIMNEVNKLRSEVYRLGGQVTSDVQQNLNNQIKMLTDKLSSSSNTLRTELQRLQNEASKYLTEDKKQELRSKLASIKQQIANSSERQELSRQVESLENKLKSSIQSYRGNVNQELESLEARVAELMKQNPEIQSSLSNILNNIKTEQRKIAQKLNKLSPQVNELQKNLSLEGSGASERLSTSSDAFLNKLNNVLAIDNTKQLGGKNITGSRKLYFSMDSLNQFEMERPRPSDEFHDQTLKLIKDIVSNDADAKVIKAVLWKKAVENNKDKSNLDKSKAMLELATKKEINNIIGSDEFEEVKRSMEQHFQEKASSPKPPKKQKKSKSEMTQQTDEAPKEDEPKKPKKTPKKKKSTSKK